MASSMPSEQLQLLIAGYILGDLDSEEAVTFEQLLAENPALLIEVEQMQKALELVYASAEVVPPAHLRAAVLAPTQAPTEIPTQILPLQTPTLLPPHPFPWGKALGAAAAILLVVLGLSNYRLWQTLQTLQALQTLQDQKRSFTPLTYALKTTNPSSAATAPATAMVVVNPNTLEANLIVNNLPPLPPGKVYALWTVLEAGAPLTVDSKNAILTEVFRVNAQGSFAATITVPEVYQSEALITKVAITVEDADAPQAHVGTPILMTNS